MGRQTHYIREWREAAGLSQERLAELVNELLWQWEPTRKEGVGRPQVSKIESGRRGYKQEVLEAMAEVIGCLPSDLLSRRPDEPAATPPDLAEVAALWRQIPEAERDRALRVLHGFVEA